MRPRTNPGKQREGGGFAGPEGFLVEVFRGLCVQVCQLGLASLHGLSQLMEERGREESWPGLFASQDGAAPRFLSPSSSQSSGLGIRAPWPRGWVLLPSSLPAPALGADGGRGVGRRSDGTEGPFLKGNANLLAQASLLRFSDVRPPAGLVRSPRGVAGSCRARGRGCA